MHQHHTISWYQLLELACPLVGLSVYLSVTRSPKRALLQLFIAKSSKKLLTGGDPQPRLHEFTRAKGCLDFSKWCIYTSVSGETCQNDQSIWRLSFPNPRELRRHWWSGMKLSVQFQPSYPPPFRNFTINSSAGSSFPASIPYTSQIAKVCFAQCSTSRLALGSPGCCCCCCSSPCPK